MTVKPVEKEDGDMMVDMQKRKLSPFLSEDDEDRIPKVPYFRGVEQPQKIGNGWVVLVVSDAGKAGVIVTVRKHTSFDGHVRAHEDLRYVVKEFERVWVDGSDTIFHNFGSNNNKQEVRQCNGECRREIGQRPTLLNQNCSVNFLLLSS